RVLFLFFFSSRRRHTRFSRDWSSDVCSSDLGERFEPRLLATAGAYVRFATRDAALLELMFAGKHKQESGALHEAGERAFSVIRRSEERRVGKGCRSCGASRQRSTTVSTVRVA